MKNLAPTNYQNSINPKAKGMIYKYNPKLITSSMTRAILLSELKKKKEETKRN